MPTTFTHDLFGKEVYRQLPAKLQRMIRSHGNLYRIGLHGPDILFYYRLGKNPVNRLGASMHREEAKAFFARGLQTARETKDEALLVYLLGFACHFLLDSTCHPYIGTLTDAGTVSHGRIESEWDRVLLWQEGKDPYHYYPSCAVTPKIEAAKTIHRAIPEISYPTLYATLKWMKGLTNLMVCDDNGRKQRVILPLLKLIGLYRYVGDNFMRKEQDLRCLPMIEHLQELKAEALAEAPGQLLALYQVYESGGEVPERFERNYE